MGQTPETNHEGAKSRLFLPAEGRTVLLPDASEWPKGEDGKLAPYALEESRFRRRRLKDRDLVEVDEDGKPIAGGPALGASGNGGTEGGANDQTQQTRTGRKPAKQAEGEGKKD